MTVLDVDSTIRIEGSARIVRGLLVPYSRPTVVADRADDGSVLVCREVFDEQSVILPRHQVPLLVSHDASRPIGRCLVDVA